MQLLKLAVAGALQNARLTGTPSPRRDELDENRSITVPESTTGIAHIRPTGLDFIEYSQYQRVVDEKYAGGCAYIEGSIVPLSEARISIFDQGYIHSDVTYTVFHVWHGNVFRMDDHLERLFSNAASLRIAPPVPAQKVRELALEMVARTQLREAYVAVSITRGFNPTNPGERNIRNFVPQMYMYVLPYQWSVSFDMIEHGQRVVIPRALRRTPRNSIDPQVKNYQWGDLIRGLQEAHGSGGDTAVLLDSDGFVAEGPGFNIAMIKDGVLSSPGRHALPGVTRKTVFEIAKDLAVPACTADITYAELLDADEVLGCTTAGGVWPIVSIDDHDIGDGTPGSLTKSIIRRYWALMDQPSSLLTAVEY